MKIWKLNIYSANNGMDVYLININVEGLKLLKHQRKYTNPARGILDLCKQKL